MTKAGSSTAADEDEGAAALGIASPPPARFSPAAKAEWYTAPELLRAEVLRLERELTAGLKKHQSAAARDASLSEFHALAAKGGTTLKEAVSAYVSVENLLRTDIIKGLELICQNAGQSLKDVAAKVLGVTPSQGQGGADATAEAVLKFAAAHPRFEELSEDIVFFIESGRADDLEEAYDLAERFSSSTATASLAR
jgi:hypothetical protein